MFLKSTLNFDQFVYYHKLLSIFEVKSLQRSLHEDNKLSDMILQS